MQEVLKSLVRVPAAITVFSVQQVQDAFGSTGTKEPAEKLCGVIGAAAHAVSAGIDWLGQAAATAADSKGR